jgi:PIN domain nuclease of toxin-antitoxin system
MNLLLDTPILLWALAKPKQLPDKAVKAIYQANNVFFSPVSLGDWY